MEDSELRDRLRIAGNGPYPMRGSMTSEEYIIRLLQTIGSLDSTMRSMRDELVRLREKDSANDLERKRLMAMIEAKDEDIRKMTGKMSDLLGKVDALTKALEDFE